MPTTSHKSERLQVSLFDAALEQGALGAAMLVPAQAEELISYGHAGLFSTTTHRDIYEAIVSLGPHQLDYTLLASEMQRRGCHVSWTVLERLDFGVVPQIPMSSRIERLEELYRLRCLACLAESLEGRVRATNVSSAEIVRWLNAELEHIGE
jgi:replicative DNA helicase